ncbi:MAG: S41 family peptidase [Porphyromonadaceae bacterium]|nr:S41 family peptidase [Porphyromonadaceae bacterium]
MTKNSIWVIILIVFSAIAGIVIGNEVAKNANSGKNLLELRNILSLRGQSNKLDQLLSLIDSEYVDNVPLDSLTEEAMNDIISKLDPHSVYIPAADYENVNSELEGSFSGIGVQFNIQNDTIMIVSVISGGPSEKAGIMAGDRIIQVNDTAFVGKDVINNEKVLRKLRGPKGTVVKVGVKRFGTPEMLTYKITRGEIPLHSVTVSYIIEPGVGFIGLNNNFGTNTYNEFLHAIAELRAKGATKYIIDLRENSGGLMDVAIRMINEFLPKGQMIVYSEGKAYPRTEAKADGTGTCINNPLVVLIDEFSASASEIFAGAIQDNDRGTIIGRRSFGKGLVQTQIPFADGSAVRLTVARYFTPSGRSIQKPYEIGKGKDYEMDILKRFEHGEFDSKDSIQLSDSLTYKTLKGRTVYGGGGIMPDIFVPRDTSKYSPYLTKVVNYGYTYQFAFQYTDKNRAALKKYKNWQEMEKFLSTQNLLNEFIAFANVKGVKPVKREIDISKDVINNQIKSYIVRNMLGDSNFFPMVNKEDEAIKKALVELRKES